MTEVPRRLAPRQNPLDQPLCLAEITRLAEQRTQEFRDSAARLSRAEHSLQQRDTAIAGLHADLELARRRAGRQDVEHTSLNEQFQEHRRAHAALLSRHAELRCQYERQSLVLQAMVHSRAWRLVCLLRKLGCAFCPQGSRRHRIARAAWRFLRQTQRFLSLKNGPRPALPVVGTAPVPPRPGGLLNRTGGASVPTERNFRVVFIGAAGPIGADSMRYRAHNMIEALARAGREARYATGEEVGSRLPWILAHDLIVLVRQELSEATARVLEAAREARVPVVYDIDDYIVEPWVLPFIETYRAAPLAELERIGRLRTCLEKSDYFTSSTEYLVEKVAALNQISFRIPNGLNAEQLELSRLALEQRSLNLAEGTVRLGYFSGTRSHEADFRVAYLALLRVLEEFDNVRLVIVGHLDLNQFPGLSPFAGRVETRPFVDWRSLPAEIARVDVNLIPLELNPFTEGKSELKYFEAGIVHVPSLASPTSVLQAAITDGENGLLARTPEDWYDALKQLIGDGEFREWLGQNAYHHVLNHYVPAVTAAEAVAVYKEIIRRQRLQRGIPADALCIVFLVAEIDSGSAERAAILGLAQELAGLGHAVTIHVARANRFSTAADLGESLAATCGPLPFALQVGGDVPCCDLLLATDYHSAYLAQANAGRAHQLAYLVLAYEPLCTAPLEECGLAVRSYELGLRTVTVGSYVAQLLALRHGVRAAVLPGWVDTRGGPAPLQESRPGIVMHLAPGLRVKLVRAALAALEQLHHRHPDVEIILLGPLPDGVDLPVSHRRIPNSGSPDANALLAGRPVCALLGASNLPLQTYRLLSLGCPVVGVSQPGEGHAYAAEFADCLVVADPTRDSLSQALGIVLYDEDLRTKLVESAGRFARELPTARDTARLLLELLQGSLSQEQEAPTPAAADSLRQAVAA